MTAFAQHLQKVDQQVLDKVGRDERKEWKDKMQASPNGAQAFRHARRAFTPPLTALRCDDGRIVTSPDSMDSLMRTKWAQVYEGNSRNHSSTIVNYLAT